MAELSGIRESVGAVRNQNSTVLLWRKMIGDGRKQCAVHFWGHIFAKYAERLNDVKLRSFFRYQIKNSVWPGTQLQRLLVQARRNGTTRENHEYSICLIHNLKSPLGGLDIVGLFIDGCNVGVCR